MRVQSTKPNRPCPRCGSPMPAANKFVCSRACVVGASKRKSKTIAERFWAKVQKGDGCWVWTAGKIQAGYGILATRVDGRTVYVRAHRLSWELHFGPIPEGAEVCHNCPGGDNPSCVRPDHLFLGTHADNMADMARKGRTNSRFVRGEKNKGAKLSEAVIRKAKKLREAGHSYGSISRRFGVSDTAIYSALTGKLWKHLNLKGPEAARDAG